MGIPSRARALRRALASVFVGAAALSAIAPSSHACSVCIAHALGAAMHGIGAQTLPHRTLVVGVNYLTFSKSNGTEDGGTENEDYRETSLNLDYGLNDRLTLRGVLPWVDKRIQATGASAETARGLGDASLGLLYQVPPSAKGRVLTAFQLDLKLPTGANSAKDETGALKEQHLQPGTGSTDVAAGASLTWEGRAPGELWFAGLRGRINGTNSRRYHFGDALFYDLGYTRPVSKQAAVVLELNGRLADKDTVEDGSKDPNSGGLLGYLSFSYRHNLSRDQGLIVTFQQPVLKNLYGTQDEKALFSVSLSRTF